MKRKLMFAVMLLMMMTVLMFTVHAQTAQSGSCGELVSWTLDENGVLTISGAGEMADYEPYDAPWYPVRKSVTSIVIEDGVTAVGEYAFYHCTKATSVTLSP